MGMLSDILASANSIDVGNGDGVRGIDKALLRELNGYLDRQGDIEYPADCVETNEVQSIAVFGGEPTDGNFTLAFELYGGISFETDPIAYDADDETIEAAIDSAAAAAEVPDWTDGDIAVSGGSLDSAPVVLTYSGDSVKGRKHGTVAIDAEGVTGGTAGAVTVTTDGQTQRTAWALLKATGCIAGDLPVQGEAPTGLTRATTAHTNPYLPSQALMRALAREAAIVDGNEDVESAILTALGLE